MAKFNFSKRYKILSAMVIALGLLGTTYFIVRATSLSVTDTFNNETKIGHGTSNVEIAGGQVKIAQCYIPNPSWTFIAATVVRDISSPSYTATVNKDIYCDNTNCLLWTSGAGAPSTVCIATNSNVYGNILWSKTNDSTSVTWADSNFSISGGDIGGTQSANLIVGGNTNVGNKVWLERYYTNTSGMFNAQDICKAKGPGWRLPNILELDSIRDQAKGSSPYTRVPNIVATYYWSATEGSSTSAYYLTFLNGSVYNFSKSTSYYVRCVRGQ